MNQDPTFHRSVCKRSGRVIGVVWLCDAPMMKTLMDERIAAREPLEKVFVFDIVHWDVEVLIALGQGRIIVELPIKDRDYVCDIGIPQCLWAT